MFLPHVWVDGPEGKGRLEVVKDGLGIGRYYALRQEKEATLQDLNTDSYDRFLPWSGCSMRRKASPRSPRRRSSKAQ